ncbi:hypothetical protein Hdeb2414_s0017g00508771 [Helianthus debilis subsp. tardiflorus]
MVSFSHAKNPISDFIGLLPLPLSLRSAEVYTTRKETTPKPRRAEEDATSIVLIGS